MILKVKRLRPAAKLPTRSGPLEAGLDLHADAAFVLRPGAAPARVPTGVAVELPPGHVGLVCDRSSLGSRGLKVFGGVVDETYRGELFVCLGNCGAEDYHLFAGDRVAQLLVLPCALPAVEEVAGLSASRRGAAGFGSSGR